MVYAVAINREQGIVMLDCGCVLQMSNYLDLFGEDTDDAQEAAFAIAKHHDGQWVVVDLTEFDKAMVRH